MILRSPPLAMADKKFEDVALAEADIPGYEGNGPSNGELHAVESTGEGQSYDRDGEYHRSFSARQIHVRLGLSIRTKVMATA